MAGEFEGFDDGIIIGAKLGDKDGEDTNKEGNKDSVGDLETDGVFSVDKDIDGNSDN